jgi:hypothetical protein
MQAMGTPNPTHNAATMFRTWMARRFSIRRICRREMAYPRQFAAGRLQRHSVSLDDATVELAWNSAKPLTLKLHEQEHEGTSETGAHRPAGRPSEC